LKNPRHVRLCLAALLLVLSPAAASAQALAWFPFEDGTATDATGNGNDGTLNGSPLPEPGIVGQSLRLRLGDSITVPDSGSLQTSTPSILFWIRRDPGTTRPSRLVRKVGAGSGYGVSLLQTGIVRFDIFEGTAKGSVSTPFPLTAGVWTMIYAAYDGNNIELYVHGELAASVEAPGIDPANSGDITLGARLDGQIDEVKFGTGNNGARFACGGALKIWHSPSNTCLNTFTNVAEDEGLTDVFNRSFGATLVDIDQDGWIDLYFINGAGDPDIAPLPPTGTCPDLPDPIPFFNGSNALHMNQGDGTFGPDTAAEVGIADQWNAMRHVWAD
jgi:hypothetical protein